MVDFLVNYWQLIFTPISIVIAYIFGGKQQQKVDLKKGVAQAQQEDTRAKKDLADLERDIYTRIVETMKGELESRDEVIEKMQKEQKAFKDEQKSFTTIQKGLIKTIEIQKGNIKHLQEIVADYKAICDTCQFRQEEVTLRKTK